MAVSPELQSSSEARRNYSGLTIFPDDENGNVLRDIAAQADDLTKARDIDFTVVFAQASSAEQFAEHFRELGYAVSVRGITDFENELQLVADRWDGHNDG